MSENIPLQLNEEIAPIQLYEGLYSITSLGYVWSHQKINKYNGRVWEAKFLKPRVSKKGYLYVNLWKNKEQKSCAVHRLVAQAFIPNSLKLPEVNHKDTDKQNNHKDNLEWCIDQENQNHASVKGLRYKIHSKYYGVSFDKHLSYRKKPWRVRVTMNKKQKHIGSFKTELEAAKAYNSFIMEYNLNRPLN